MYSYIVRSMTWSFSRISAFQSCPYRFFLQYIMACEQRPCFFSSYGSFVHDLIAKYYSGQRTGKQLCTDYLMNFRSSVTGRAPSQEIFDTYFRQGLECFQNIRPLEGKVLSTEQEVHFSVEGYPFVGFVDLVCTDAQGNLCIIDHKSRALKSRSGRKKPTKSDIMLDEYLTQLYLYSIAIREQCGRYPDKLIFNCYRTGNMIASDFEHAGLERAKQWAVTSIERAVRTNIWSPGLNYWSCRHMCGVRHECEYYQMTGGGHD